MLVTLGMLFLFDSIGGIEFHRTWPAILLVIGIVKLMQSNASSEGHTGPLPPVAGFPATPPTGFPPTPPPGAPPDTTPSGAAPDSEQPPSSGEVNHV
jgi:hypothetical protein